MLNPTHLLITETLYEGLRSEKLSDIFVWHCETTFAMAFVIRLFCVVTGLWGKGWWGCIYNARWMQIIHEAIWWLCYFSLEHATKCFQKEGITHLFTRVTLADWVITWLFQIIVDDDNSKEWTLYDAGPKSIKCPLICFPPASGGADVYFRQILGLSAAGFRVIGVGNLSRKYTPTVIISTKNKKLMKIIHTLSFETLSTFWQVTSLKRLLCSKTTSLKRCYYQHENVARV